MSADITIEIMREKERPSVISKKMRSISQRDKRWENNFFFQG